MVVVVLTPQMGDEVQGMKAGLAEIADILVVNKADLSGADETLQQLKALFADEDFHIVATSAIKDQGIIRSWPALRSTGTRARIAANIKDADSVCAGRNCFLCCERKFSLSLQKDRRRFVRNTSQADRRTAKDPHSAVDKLAKRIGI
jgi:LAO/AO transport system kinase